MSVREDRLWSEYETMRKWRSPVISWRVIGSTKPPDTYEINCQIKSLIGFDIDNRPVFHTGFRVLIEFAGDYPREKPEVRLDPSQKPWPIHPNIFRDGRFCLEGTQHWIPGIGVPIDSICQMVGEILAYQEVYTRSPANGNTQLLSWVQDTIQLINGTQNKAANPVDPVSIRLADLDDAISWGNDTPPADAGLIIFGE